MANQILVLAVLTMTSLTCTLVIAFEPSPLQDFCVADTTSSGLHIAGNTSNPLGVRITPVNVAQISGLNTLGISLARIDYAPWGVTPPHTHPRATEILTVLEGTVAVGFVTSNPDNKLISKVLNKGDVFVFPVGLVHYQQNVGNGTAVSLSSLSSQNPGVITIANSVFGANPSISDDVLAKAFQVDKSIISDLQIKF
ncbi:putative germin-like protein 2-1 isoform X3 [Argentina anserina]|uniref:putative germin-like protein 2-1 isoform X3 n=1 Tax=Argentina anserina TaxID=57926 RepID=UPI0021767A23|nr:putative germin-like protein 2-1 isoform X3 [Potentilla anserina]